MVSHHLPERTALICGCRYERELAFKAQQAAGKDAAIAAVTGAKEGVPKGQTSATFDAFMRMAAGKEVRVARK